MVSSTHIPSEFCKLKIAQVVPLSQGMKQGLFLNTFKSSDHKVEIRDRSPTKLELRFAFSDLPRSLKVDLRGRYSSFYFSKKLCQCSLDTSNLA